MTCQNCVRHATEALQAVPGVARVRLKLEAERAEVWWHDDVQVDLASLLGALDAVGFQGKVLESQEESSQETTQEQGLSQWSRNLIVGAPVFLLMLVAEWGMDWGTHPAYRRVAFFASVVVLWVAGWPFYQGAWQQLKRGRSNMDTLVSLGASAAFLFSVWGWLSGKLVHLYFMETVGILTLISFGHWLEARISAKASGTLRSLMQLAPTLARKRMADGRYSEVKVGDLQVGDQVELRPGDQVPTDGVVTEGVSAVDESMLSGESMPVEKSEGAKVYAATQNQQGRLLVRVTGLGEDTALARIIRVVEHAQNSRARIQKLGDRVSSVFVPIVVLLALVTVVGWTLWPEGMRLVTETFEPWLWHASIAESVLATAIIHGVSVLIVACPCAMGLATPAAIMAGANAAAARGILIRDGEALEKSGQVSVLAFDKTGTLTEGKPALVDTCILDDAMDQDAVLALAASIASRSAHPLSQAVAGAVDHADSNAVHWEHWSEQAGAGLRASRSQPDTGTEHETVMLGSLAWLEGSGIALEGSEGFQQNWMSQGASVIGLARGKTLLAVFALRDTLKPQAREMIARLQQDGWEIHLVTGDHQRTGHAIAAELGMEAARVHAEIKPDQKADLVQSLQSQGKRVAFVGDGINDAPALEQADLGIAVSRASDIAREAADIVLLKTDIQAIPQALILSRATLRTIKQNLFWAFFYNAAAIPLAMFGFMSPLLCAAAMGLSDVLVIGNALRLRFR